MQVTLTPDEPRLFWFTGKLQDPQFEPHAGIKMVQTLLSPLHICVRKSFVWASWSYYHEEGWYCPGGLLKYDLGGDVLLRLEK